MFLFLKKKTTKKPDSFFHLFDFVKLNIIN